jgi:3-isopropylmalate/(R)-2-methylmalate dehydratase large subunit
MSQTIFEKIWRAHEILRQPNGMSLLWIDRHYLHEGSGNGFGQLAARGAGVAYPALCTAVADHYVATRQRPVIAGAERMITQLGANARLHGIRLFDTSSAGQGIVHVIGPERGLTLPGLTIVCGDSHTSTHGAFGAIAFGIGASEVAHVLMTQTLWQKRPKLMRVHITGTLARGVTAKDMVLAIILRLGAGGASGFAVEYAGDAVRALSMEGRQTLCNMSIECGARCGLVAPDEVTLAYLRGRPDAPADFDAAAEHWMRLATDPDVAFDRELVIDGAEIAPIVTWGISPDEACAIDGAVPDPDRMTDPVRATHAREALAYMGLRPGQRLQEVAIDQIFIGSCTNGRIEDLRAAASLLAGRRAVVPGLVSPGSKAVKIQAEQEGLDRIFVDAGLEWGASGCSMCVGMNGDVVDPGRRCASTTNRNFRGRQGPDARTHLMSPAMAAAAALTGHLTDVRRLLLGDLPC